MRAHADAIALLGESTVLSRLVRRSSSMLRPGFEAASKGRPPRSARRRLEVLALEPRLLLHAGEVHEPVDLGLLATSPSYEVSPDGNDATGGGTDVAVGATGPLLVPALGSLAGASA